MSENHHELLPAEREERDHLDDVEARLKRNLDDTDARLRHYAQDIQDQKEYLWSSRDEMDHVEKISARESIQQAVMTGEATQAKRNRLLKLFRSPYFGRLDFAQDHGKDAEPIYIGIHHFHDDLARRNVVYDWRAPIASLFYDYETGAARYESPEGHVDGEIRLKRQFRIKHGEIELMIDSAVNVVDDVLQEELSRSSDEGMKNIVATIQRDQNAIIRNDDAKVLIIQGVAGSGKTSIALHRIAYLLYRFKDSLSSEDILIISPNRVFADYIANVLPELGEESVNEVGMEDLAHELLDGQYRFQTFFEQTSMLLEKDDEAMKARLRYKASTEFLKQLDAYAAHVEQHRFAAEDLWIARRLVPGWLLEEVFRKHRSLPSKQRIKQVAWEIERKIGNQYNYDLMPEERKELTASIRQMLRESTLRETYKGFYEWVGQPEYFKAAKGGKLEYADVFPMIYLKMRLDGVHSAWRNVKHLLIDEMQDYTPVQYAVIGRLFSCRKTILGDAYQSVNPYSGSKAEEIRGVLHQAAYVTLNKSFRSSYEITRFAQRISPNPELEVIERHGDEPDIIKCRTKRDETATIAELITAFAASDHNTLGVVCKTQKQAQRLFDGLKETVDNLQLLSEQSLSFSTGVIICTAHMAKGLEFDRVIVPDVSERNYVTEMDRNLLYVACTRAMHRLTLTHTGRPASFIEQVE
ncbi:HelD family protein [Aidingimonas halophila]|uniref:DNA 3'-5' helicase n=1 Tax=Aidingimonas halophila TaxID=574349 RepID=A0A1H2S9J6_9GAMM|nr:3'-5' exonuclease [Aidingimonas halophila]GHC18014.1 DNA helicase [Aidingimonas halophila]SDW28190.1 DNA helicase-2 / ATP-dependent DNA helicase PcrA [Aidingimonas halophila]